MVKAHTSLCSCIVIVVHLQKYVTGESSDECFYMGCSMEPGKGSIQKLISIILQQTISCEYSLESPHWGDSNEYSQDMFWHKNKNYPELSLQLPLYSLFYLIPFHILWVLIGIASMRDSVSIHKICFGAKLKKNILNYHYSYHLPGAICLCFW